MPKPDFVLVANSPGELSALVQPVAAEIARRRLGRIILVLTPCQYTSGQEQAYVKSLKEISKIIPAEEYKKWIFWRQSSPAIEFAPQGVVLFLGGDLAHAMLVAKRLGYPAYAYLNEILTWKGAYKKFFVPDLLTYRKFSKKLDQTRLIVTGNLMVDAVARLPKWRPENQVVTFMPGSRRWEIDYMVPLYQKVMGLLKRENKELKFQLVSSPFVPAPQLPGVTTIPFAELHNSELVVTIPGTNTAKLAARGIPMIVVFPLNQPEVIPFDGLGQLLGQLPLLGKYFKRAAVNIINKRTKFFALPNQKAEKELVPEIRGQVYPVEIAGKVMELLKNKERRKSMSLSLIKALGPTGAAARLVEEISRGL